MNSTIGSEHQWSVHKQEGKNLEFNKRRLVNLHNEDPHKT
jgi:hypothetical protein